MSLALDFLNANPALVILISAVVTLIVLVSALSRRNRALSRQLKRQNDAALRSIALLSETLARSSGGLDASQDRLRESVERRLDAISAANDRKLEQMRALVDERLTATLEARLGSSFRLVSEQLERVYGGLGEMKNLAAGVGDLKRVLTNVSTRGAWGEVRLAAILSQTLTPSQYAANVRLNPKTTERVEFAIVLPGREDAPVYLPVDSKFPQEDYLRLLDANERGDAAAAEQAAKALEKVVRGEAERIADKYILPPATTDFAILFLPVESLYAEALRRPGLIEEIQKKSRVVVTGPTNFSALLNSLQMGFKTLAVEKRACEVISLLGSVRTEFARFGESLDKAKSRIAQAADDLDAIDTRKRAMLRQLRDVERDS